MISIALIYLCLTTSTPCRAAEAPAGPPSASRLSAHLIARYTPGARQIVAARPRVLKVLDLHADMVEALRDYKRRVPRGKTVLRIFTRQRYAVSDDPVQSARHFWETVLWPPLQRLSPEDRRLIDYLEGPNEGDSTPTWESVEHARWFGAFWVELAATMRRAGFRPCVGSIAVGNPPGSPEEIARKIRAFLPALQAAQAAGGAWSYHSYTVEYTEDLAVEAWYSLRYRMLHDIMAREDPRLARLPLIITEGGVDRDGNPLTSGWSARGTLARYLRWLRWFDSELRKDPYVIGVTLFQIGDPLDWGSFDLEPAAAGIAALIRSPTASAEEPRSSGVLATRR